MVTSIERVPAHTSPEANERIRRRARMNIWYYREHPEEIPQRLDELDREWDIERALETMSASMSLAGLALGITRGRRWLLLPLIVQGFFLQHAVQGWCPPLPVLRRMGFRTEAEIMEERCALQAITAGVATRNGDSHREESESAVAEDEDGEEARRQNRAEPAA